MTNFIKTALLALILTTITTLAGTLGARAAAPPVKLEPIGHIDNEFQDPESVAVAPNGNIYVADSLNKRIQELTPSGTFVLMFGQEVNATKVAAVKAKGGAPTQEELEEENLCTATSGDTCQAGVEGTGAAAFGSPESVAVDPSTGDVWVKDTGNERVEEFTAGGGFVAMFGKEVNESTQHDFCSEQEVTVADVHCKAGVAGAGEHGTFDFFGSAFQGNNLAESPASASQHLLYVGEQDRVQELEGDGTWVGEIPMPCIVATLAVDAAGDVYAACREDNTIHEFNSSRVEVKQFTISPKRPGGAVQIEAFALDPAGHLAVSVLEIGAQGGSEFERYGILREAGTGQPITEFSLPREGSGGVAFNGEPEAELYAATFSGSEVLVFRPVPVAELLATSSTCVAGPDSQTDATLDCSLNGTVNPEGVAGTEAWVEWGRTPALGEMTPRQKVESPEAVSVPVAGARPSETFYYRVAAYDQNVQPPEHQLASETLLFSTPVVAPRIVGEPSVQIVRSSSVVVFGEVNPENASTSYEFQYGTCADLESCPGVSSTIPLESAQYGNVAATREVTGLQPDTTYHYRLLASNEHEAAGKLVGGIATSAQGTFTTAPAPAAQALTGSPSAITATSATLSGSVDPDGQSATYAFELGVYDGAQTQYGIVFSGPAGAGTGPVSETLGLSGLQPGTTYAYRITIKSGYTPRGEALLGEPALFTTAGQPAVLMPPNPLAMLAIPSIAFPKATVPARPKAKKKSKPKKKPRHGRRDGKGAHARRSWRAARDLWIPISRVPQEEAGINPNFGGT